ncbi:MAG: WG repeat-containing protein [Methylacidiphilales bacterium]|nr:WG repeat-containing protein [Candidatus Methylacidiphilales bacterium]
MFKKSQLFSDLRKLFKIKLSHFVVFFISYIIICAVGTKILLELNREPEIFPNCTDSFNAKINNRGGYVPKKSVAEVLHKGINIYNIDASALKSIPCGASGMGYINKEGVIILPFNYENARSFSKDGTAFVKHKDKWGVINTKGEFIISPRFELIKDPSFNEGRTFNEGRIINEERIFNEGKIVGEGFCLGGDDWGDCTYMGYVNSKGEITFPPKYLFVFRFNRFGFGVYYNHFDSEYARLLHYSLGGLFTENRELVEIKSGLVNVNGEIIVPAIYETIRELYTDGSYIVVGQSEKDGTNKYGLINVKGEKVLPIKYTSMLFFSKEHIQVSFDNDYKKGIINWKGEEIIPPKYDVVNPFYGELFYVKLFEKWGLINSKGEEIIPPKYDDINNIKEGYLAVNKNKKWGLINSKGEEIIPPKYDDIYSMKEGYLAASKNKKWGLINSKGVEVVSPQYDLVSNFNSNGLAIVKLNNKWGYVNAEGKLISPLNFNAYDFAINSDGELILKRNNASYTNVNVISPLNHFIKSNRVSYDDPECNLFSGLIYCSYFEISDCEYHARGDWALYNSEGKLLFNNSNFSIPRSSQIHNSELIPIYFKKCNS